MSADETVAAVLAEARRLPTGTCLYDGDDGEWCEGFEQGVRFIIDNLWRFDALLPGPALEEAIKGHRPVHDAIPRCKCGRGFAAARHLEEHIAEEIGGAATPEVAR